MVVGDLNANPRRGTDCVRMLFQSMGVEVTVSFLIEPSDK